MDAVSSVCKKLEKTYTLGGLQSANIGQAYKHVVHLIQTGYTYFDMHKRWVVSDMTKNCSNIRHDFTGNLDIPINFMIIDYIPNLLSQI
jgi:hypothetical protein